MVITKIIGFFEHKDMWSIFRGENQRKWIVRILSHLDFKCKCCHVSLTSFDDFLSHLTILRISFIYCELFWSIWIHRWITSCHTFKRYFNPAKNGSKVSCRIRIIMLISIPSHPEVNQKSFRIHIFNDSMSIHICLLYTINHK